MSIEGDIIYGVKYVDFDACFSLTHCPDSGMLAQWCGFGGAVVCQLRRSHDDD